MVDIFHRKMDGVRKKGCFFSLLLLLSVNGALGDNQKAEKED